MKLSRLSYHTGDALFTSPFPSREKVPEYYERRDQEIEKLLACLADVEGPDLWYGLSNGILNFCARDIRDAQDQVPALAFIRVKEWEENVNGAVWYSVEYPLPREMRPWFPLSAEMALSQGNRVPEKVYPRVTGLNGAENLWSSAWCSLPTKGLKQTANCLLNAIAVSDANPARDRADWLWYICPQCDLHVPRYQAVCERCGQTHESEVEMQRSDFYRKVQLPTGAVAPMKFDTATQK